MNPLQQEASKGTPNPKAWPVTTAKWETLRTYRCKLKSSEVLKPRLDVSCLARRAGDLDSSSEPVDFALVVTITEDGSTELYDRVTTAFPNLIKIATPHARIQT